MANDNGDGGRKDLTRQFTGLYVASLAAVRSLQLNGVRNLHVDALRVQLQEAHQFLFGDAFRDVAGVVGPELLKQAAAATAPPVEELPDSCLPMDALKSAGVEALPAVSSQIVSSGQ